MTVATIQENVSATIAYKVESVFGTAAGASGAQYVRRVSSSLGLKKDSFQSNEVRSDQQVNDMRHGARRPAGRIDGELSLTTYNDWLEALLRGTWTAGASKSNTEFTSAAADNATSKFTFGGGDPIAEGLRVGDTIRFTGLSAAANNSVNFKIVSFGGASNRDVTVTPAPATMSADTSFTVAVQGKKLNVGTTKRSFTLEQTYPDIDGSEQFLGARVGSGAISIPPNGMATVGFDWMCYNGAILSGVSSPYFSSPTAETTTGLFTGLNGTLLKDGVAIGVVTGLDINVNLNLNSNPVIGQNTVPNIFYGRTVVTGNLSAYLSDVTLLEAFDNETEMSVQAVLELAEAAPAGFLSFTMHRVKFQDVNKTIGPEGGVVVQFPYQALRKEASGYDTGSITIQRSDP